LDNVSGGANFIDGYLLATAMAVVDAVAHGVVVPIMRAV
jgi:hypothetical protein